MKIFKKLTIKNFMSINSAEIVLEKQGLVLVQGHNKDDASFESNGAGKSSVFEALSWAIFEKTIRGLSGDEVVNKNIGRNCVVFLDFIDDFDNSEYRIARYRKHNEHKNSLFLFKDGKNITSKSVKDTNLLIEKIIQTDFLSFTNSILFGQGLVKMFSVSTDKEKKEILENMLQMGEIKSCLEIAKQKLQVEKTNLSELQLLLTKQETVEEETEQTITELKNEQKNQKEKYKLQIQELLSKIKESEKELEDCIANIEENESSLNSMESVKDKLQKKLDEKKEFETIKYELKIKIRQLEDSQKSINDEIKKLKVEEVEISSGKSKNCKLCGQIIKSEESSKEAINHIKQKIDELSRKLEDVINELDDVSKQLETNDKIIKKYEKYSEKYELLREETYELKSKVTTDKQLKKILSSGIEDMKKTIESLEEDIKKSYESIILQKENLLEEIKNEIERLKNKKSELDKKIEQLKFWVEAFGNSGIKSYLLDTVTPFLNNKANEYLSKLAGATMRIEFSTQTRLANGELRDKFEIRLLNNVGGDSYESNSEGEKRRIDLAISLALQDLIRSRSNSKLNILLYDEIFDSLDSVGCENAIQLLTGMQEKVDSIFVITHNDILKTYFDKYLHVTKENGLTSIYKEG